MSDLLRYFLKNDKARGLYQAAEIIEQELDLLSPQSRRENPQGVREIDWIMSSLESVQRKILVEMEKANGGQ